jgi:hypothetical protein
MDAYGLLERLPFNHLGFTADNLGMLGNQNNAECKQKASISFFDHLAHSAKLAFVPFIIRMYFMTLYSLCAG